MIRTIIGVLILLLIIYVGYFFWYKPHQQMAQADSGSFQCQGCLTGEAKERFERENSGETADGNSERKTTSSRVAAEEAASDSTVGPNASAPGTPYNGTAPSSGNAPAGTSTMVAPSPAPAYPAPTPVYVPPTAPTQAPPPSSVPMNSYNSMGAPPPAYDTVAPNPPNGTVFAGKGAYQWYRQGNLTWRVDSVTGRACIAFATMDEWQKQIVMSHGCGRSA